MTKSILSLQKGHTFGKYLGYPIFMRRPTKQDFQFLLDNFKNQLASWKAPFLTTAGRATLIRSTLNSLPNHVMYLFKLPTYVIKRMVVYQRNFFWENTPERKKIHLLSWASISKPKKLGGLGIQQLVNQELNTFSIYSLASLSLIFFLGSNSLW